MANSWANSHISAKSSSPRRSLSCAANIAVSVNCVVAGSSHDAGRFPFVSICDRDCFSSALVSSAVLALKARRQDQADLPPRHWPPPSVR